jgi:PST family polysaccharide transporter
MISVLPATSRTTRTLRAAAILRPEGLGRRIISGTGYKFGGTLVRTAMTIGSTAVLARMLQPSDYGYLAMATVVTELATLFSNAGMPDTLVQRRRVARIQLETVYWTMLGIGMALGTLISLVSLAAEAIFGEPAVGPVMFALGLIFPLNSLAGVSTVLLTRLMDFRTEFYISTVSLAVRSLAAIFAAWHGLGVWSLVIGTYTGVLVTLALTFAWYPFVPRLRFSAEYLRTSWRVSSTYLFGGLVYYASMNVDLLLVGRYWGATALGYYQSARSLADELRARVAAPLAQTMFPAFSSVQTDAPRMSEMLLRSTRMLAALIVMLGALLCSLAPEVVEVLFGPRWAPMVPMVRIFGASAALRGATALASPLLYAANLPGLMLKQHIIGTVLLIVFVAVALPLGVNAVAGAAALATIYVLVPYYVGARVFAIRWQDVAVALLPPAIGGLACYVAAALLREAILPFMHAAVSRALVLGAAGSLTYIATLSLLGAPHRRDIHTLLRRLSQHWRP